MCKACSASNTYLADAVVQFILLQNRQTLACCQRCDMHAAPHSHIKVCAGEHLLPAWAGMLCSWLSLAWHLVARLWQVIALTALSLWRSMGMEMSTSHCTTVALSEGGSP